nr:NADH dehydrogenase subunit 5 [Saemundssonia lari]
MWSGVWLVWLALCLITLSSYIAGVNQAILLDLGVGMYQIVLVLDQVSMMFLFMVLLVSSAVSFYSLSYMQAELTKKSFLLVFCSFIVSMGVLSVSGDIFSVMIGWDGLGLSSFALILYYKNWNSLSGGLVTFMTNRLGDVALILSICMGLAAGSTSFWIISDGGILICLAGMTKSAQIPFSAWLPMAMAAPTPVSSLVHSSTLVTAGVFLLIRFGDVLSDSARFLLLLASSITVTLAGLGSIWEEDLKKVVALSTLLHIGLMLLFVSTKQVEAAMVHMVAHAFFKSLLFMCVGELIHSSGGTQDIRQIRFMMWPKSLTFPMSVSLLSMSGLPFLSGFYSKELLLKGAWSGNKMLVWTTILLAVFFTATYSFRIIHSMVFSPVSCAGVVMSDHKFLSIWSVVSIISVDFFLGWMPSCDDREFWGFVSGVVFMVVLLGFVAGFISLNLSDRSFVCKVKSLFGLKNFLPVFVEKVRPLSFLGVNLVDFMGAFSKAVESLSKWGESASCGMVANLPVIPILVGGVFVLILLSEGSF